MESIQNGGRLRSKKENGSMRGMRNHWLTGSVLVLTGILTVPGCYNTPIDISDYAQGPAPRRMPSPANEAEGGNSYEDSLTGGQIFTMYCSYCHNAPSLAERPFANFRNVAAHMRVRANLTGKEYAKLMEFLRRWHDIPPPHPPVEPSPKRFFFSQPIPELRKETPPAPATASQPSQPQPQPQPDATKKAGDQCKD